MFIYSYWVFHYFWKVVGFTIPLNKILELLLKNVNCTYKLLGMLNKLKHFKFQGLVMEVALVVFNVFLVLSLVYVWTNFFNADTGSGDKVENYRYVKATGDSTLVE